MKTINTSLFFGKKALSNISIQIQEFKPHRGGHGGAVVTHSPTTPEVCGSNARPYLETLVVAYQWSAVYSTEP